MNDGIWGNDAIPPSDRRATVIRAIAVLGMFAGLFAAAHDFTAKREDRWVFFTNWRE